MPVPEPDAAPVPVLRVETGRPTPEEMAAVVVAVHALTAARDGDLAGPDGSGDAASAWSDRRRAMRAALRTPATRLDPGPDAWRASAWPG